MLQALAQDKHEPALRLHCTVYHVPLVHVERDCEHLPCS